MEGDHFCNLTKNELHHVNANVCGKIFENISKRLDNVWILSTKTCLISQKTLKAVNYFYSYSKLQNCKIVCASLNWSACRSFTENPSILHSVSFEHVDVLGERNFWWSIPGLYCMVIKRVCLNNSYACFVTLEVLVNLNQITSSSLHKK